MPADQCLHRLVGVRADGTARRPAGDQPQGARSGRGGSIRQGPDRPAGRDCSGLPGQPRPCRRRRTDRDRRWDRVGDGDGLPPAPARWILGGACGGGGASDGVLGRLRPVPRRPRDRPGLVRAVSEEPDVLIVGGSLVGLSTALFLRLHGVSCLAVERHTSTAIHPRAGHFQLRTVEILRAAGLEEAVRRKGEEQYHPNGGINNVESLAGREIASYFPNLNAGVEEFSPTVRLFIDQDALEPILRERAQELGARLRYRTQCTALQQDGDGVTATLLDLED